jgi:hypothetical protein
VVGVQKVSPLLALNGVLLRKTPNGAAETEEIPAAVGTATSDNTSADINERERFMTSL